MLQWLDVCVKMDRWHIGWEYALQRFRKNKDWDLKQRNAKKGEMLSDLTLQEK